MFFCHGSHINCGAYEKNFKDSMSDRVTFSFPFFFFFFFSLWIDFLFLAYSFSFFLWQFIFFFSQGELRVNKFLQVEGHENIFAIGDCCNADQKMGFLAAEQG